MTAQKVISVPTERSMPEVMMTKVQAMASTPFTAVDCRMPTRLSACRNCGDAKLKNTISATRLAKASSFCRVAGRKSRDFSVLSEKPGLTAVAVGVVKGSLQSWSWVVMERRPRLRAGWRAA